MDMISLSGNQPAIVTNAVMPIENARHVFKTCSKAFTVKAEDSLLAVVRAKLENPKGRLFVSRASNAQPGVRSKSRLP
jgi:hypothetical protein